MHSQAFPPRDYLDPSGPPPRGVMRNLRIMFDVTDVVDDVHGVVDDTVRLCMHQRGALCLCEQQRVFIGGGALCTQCARMQVLRRAEEFASDTG